MTRALLTMLVLILWGGCTPDLSNSPAAQDDDDVAADDDDATSASVGCFTIGEDFWNDGFYVYRLDVEQATAEVVAGPMTTEPSLMPTLAAAGGELLGYDAAAQAILRVDAQTAAFSYTSPSLTATETAAGLVDVDEGLLMPVNVSLTGTELRWFGSADSLGGAPAGTLTLDASAEAYATDGDELVGVAGTTLLRWRLGGVSPQVLDPVPLDDLVGAPYGLEVVGDEVVVLVTDSVYRFDRLTGALISGPVEIRAPGDAWLFRGLVCLPE